MLNVRGTVQGSGMAVTRDLTVPPIFDSCVSCRCFDRIPAGIEIFATLMIGITLGHYNIASRLRTDGRGGLSPMRVTAAIILIALLMVGASAQDNVSTSEQTQIIEKARETALQYTANLPNFIST